MEEVVCVCVEKCGSGGGGVVVMCVKECGSGGGGVVVMCVIGGGGIVVLCDRRSVVVEEVL